MYRWLFFSFFFFFSFLPEDRKINISRSYGSIDCAKIIFHFNFVRNKINVRFAFRVIECIDWIKWIIRILIRVIKLLRIDQVFYRPSLHINADFYLFKDRKRKGLRVIYNKSIEWSNDLTMRFFEWILLRETLFSSFFSSK